MPFDLNQPFTLDRTSDLVVCLEVAEHVPPLSAGDFIASLTRLASIILFSAAIPYQGGDGHLNEQWPEYWADPLQQILNEEVKIKRAVQFLAIVS